MPRRVTELAESLRQQGVEVKRVINKTTHLPGQPVEVTPVGIELGNDLSIFVDRDGVIYLSWWMPDDDTWEEIGAFAPAEVDELVEAIREHTT
jgi:hypothetical protein